MGVVANGIFKGHSGFCALKFTVESSAAVIDSLFLRMYGDQGLVDSFEPNRWIEKTTSAAVSGSPLWNLMPLRMLNVQVRPSGLRAYFSATLPTTLPWASNWSSKSYSAPPHVAVIDRVHRLVAKVGDGVAQSAARRGRGSRRGW